MDARYWLSRQNDLHATEARKSWGRARRKAYWTRVLQALEGGGQQADLLDFNQVWRSLNLKHALYQGVQFIPLEKIVGSLGRYQDFTGAFFPVSQDMQERWQRVASLYLDPSGPGVPPIEAYKVGDAYFVKDGNHRVSVAHQLGMRTIEACVWEYPEPVAGLPTDADIHTLLLEAERRDFLEQTRLDALRPGHGVWLTEPGGYTDLLAQIAHYQGVLSRIDGVQMPYEEAVLAWHDLLFETVVQITKGAGVLALFPDRTPADLFVWTMRHKRHLQARYARRHITYAAIARQVSRMQRPVFWRRLLRAPLRWFARRMAR